jgi:hypothetical protein
VLNQATHRGKYSFARHRRQPGDAQKQDNTEPQAGTSAALRRQGWWGYRVDLSWRRLIKLGLRWDLQHVVANAPAGLVQISL